MKAWLGTTVFDVTAEQLDEINEIAEKEYMKTSDRAKGLQAAIDHCRKKKYPVVKEQTFVMKSKEGDAGQQYSFNQLQTMIDEAVAKALS